MKKNNIAAEIFSYKTTFFSLLSDGIKLFKKITYLQSWNNLSGRRKSGFIALLLLLSSYISCVIVLPELSSWTLFKLCFELLVGFIFASFLLIIICSKSDCFTLILETKKRIKKETVIIFTSACFLVLFLSLLANFPGATSPDTRSQWQQVQSFRFSDWHPAIHTLFLWLISRIINQYAFVIFVQISVFSFGVGRLLATLEAWGFSKKIVLVCAGFIILNPYTKNIMMYAWKDLTFTILATFTVIMMINLYLSDGAWIKKWHHVLTFAIVAGITSKIRHNGIFFTVPLVLMLLVCYTRQSKKTLISALLTIAVIVIIRYPLYTALDVHFPSQTKIESVGIPMTIMGDVLVKNPGKLPPDVKIFLNEIAPDEVWRQKYRTGEYNSIKHTAPASKIVEDIPFTQLAAMTLETIKNSPGVALTAVRDVTAIVWSLGGSKNLIGIPVHVDSTAPVLKRALNRAFRFYDSMATAIFPLKYIWSKIGWWMLALLLSGLTAFYRNGPKSLFLVIPSVMYNLGTMLLLCGPDTRFFHFNVVITLPMVLVLLLRRPNTQLLETENGPLPP